MRVVLNSQRLTGNCELSSTRKGSLVTASCPQLAGSLATAGCPQLAKAHWQLRVDLNSQRLTGNCELSSTRKGSLATASCPQLAKAHWQLRVDLNSRAHWQLRVDLNSRAHWQLRVEDNSRSGGSARMRPSRSSVGLRKPAGSFCGNGVVEFPALLHSNTPSFHRLGPFLRYGFLRRKKAAWPEGSSENILVPPVMTICASGTGCQELAAERSALLSSR